MSSLQSVVRTSCLTTPRVLTAVLLIACGIYFTLLSSSTLTNTTVFYLAPPPRPSNLSRNLPDAIIFGVRKSGTRALLEFLSLHPKLVIAHNEVHFFDKSFELGMDWYLSQMPLSKPGQLTLEKTPGYFITPTAPKRVFSMNPKVKLILIVREPVTRTISDYLQIMAARKRDNQSVSNFEDMVIDQETGDINLDYKAVQISLYYKHFQKWRDVFNRDQIHIVDGDKMISRPHEELTKVESFLGIKHVLGPDRFYFNKTKGFYCMHKNATFEKCLGTSKGRPHPKIDPEVRRKLIEFYIPYNKIFYNMTGIDFNWPVQ